MMSYDFGWLLASLGTESGSMVIAAGLASAVALSLGTVGLNVLRFISKRDLEADANWVIEFDLSRYDGLGQLFQPDDFDFLASQPGYTRKLGARLRSDRIRIAQGYLNRLERDVRLLLNTANRMAVRSSEDANGFSAFLLKTEVSFAVSLTILRSRLLLMRAGLHTPIPFNVLLNSLEPLVLRSQELAVSFG
jgi:hypothetical protein